MKKQKVLRSERLIVYLTPDEMVRLTRAIKHSRLPKTEAIRKFLLSSTYDKSMQLANDQLP